MANTAPPSVIDSVVTSVRAGPRPQKRSAPSKRETGCVDEHYKHSPKCEYDGKLSVVRFRGRVLLYARSNLLSSGARAR